MLDTGANGSLALPPDDQELLSRAGQAVRMEISEPDVIGIDGRKRESVKRYVLRSLDFGGVTFQNVIASDNNVPLVSMGLLR